MHVKNKMKMCFNSLKGGRSFESEIKLRIRHSQFYIWTGVVQLEEFFHWNPNIKEITIVILIVGVLNLAHVKILKRMLHLKLCTFKSQYLLRWFCQQNFLFLWIKYPHSSEISFWDSSAVHFPHKRTHCGSGPSPLHMRGDALDDWLVRW